MKKAHQLKGAHLKALNGIQQHVVMGRIPMYDYTCEFSNHSGETTPNPSVALIQFLNSTEKISDSGEHLLCIQNSYTKMGISTPIGIEDLPIWWAHPIINQFKNPRAAEVMCWDSVFLQGAFLDIQFPSPVDSDDSNWPKIGSALMQMHRNFIPGPFTRDYQLEEFF